MANTKKNIRLQIGIDVLQRFGRKGTIIADRMLKETPVDPRDFDRESFIREVQRRLNSAKGEKLC